MVFAEYLKSCRQKAEMTQDEVVHALYLLDEENFAGVNVSTLSRWERGITTPSTARIGTVLSFFQSRFNAPLPCLESSDTESLEKALCEKSLIQLFGRQSRMIVDISWGDEALPHFEIINLRKHPNAEELLELNFMLHQSVNTGFTKVELANFKRWLEHPAHLFSAVTYRSSFLGLLFALRLKPDSFRKILGFSLKKNELDDKDFASPDEEASIYLLSMFSFSQEVAAMLFNRLFAYLVAHQKNTDELGFLSSFDEAQLLAESMSLKPVSRHFEDNVNIISYRNDLFTLMKSPLGIQTLFPRKECN